MDCPKCLTVKIPRKQVLNILLLHGTNYKYLIKDKFCRSQKDCKSDIITKGQVQLTNISTNTNRQFSTRGPTTKEYQRAQCIYACCGTSMISYEFFCEQYILGIFRTILNQECRVWLV